MILFGANKKIILDIYIDMMIRKQYALIMINEKLYVNFYFLLGRFRYFISFNMKWEKKVTMNKEWVI